MASAVVTAGLCLGLLVVLRADTTSGMTAFDGRASLIPLAITGEEHGNEKTETREYTFEGLKERGDLSEKLLASMDGVRGVELNAEAGTARVTANPEAFCTHSALQLLRRHGIEASMKGAADRESKDVPACPYTGRQNPALKDIRNI